MIRKEKPEMPLSEIKKSIEFAGPKPPVLEKPKPRPKPIGPGKPPIGPGKPKPKPIDFGKVLGQQPITMGEGYKDEINKVRPMGDGSAMNKQYRAQGGGRFK